MTNYSTVKRASVECQKRRNCRFPYLNIWLLVVLGFNATKSLVSAQYLHVAEPGAGTKEGLLAYQVADRGTHHICLLRCFSNRVEMLFSKTLADGAILSPICVSNSVIVIETRGTVRKYSLNGTEIFSTNSLKSGEICTHAGRWDYRTVYMTAVRYTGEGERRSIEARLVWIDVNGIVPVTKWEKEIFLPLKITRVRDDAVILGNERMERISPPKELRTFLD